MITRLVCNVICWTVPTIYIGSQYGFFAGLSTFCVLWVLTSDMAT